MSKASKKEEEFSQTVYALRPKPTDEKALAAAREAPPTFVEASRFFDARAFGCRLFGLPEVFIETYPTNGEKPTPRWQIRHVGFAVNGGTIRLQARQLTPGAPTPPWCDTNKFL